MPPKVLLVDNDKPFLELYQELLSQHLSCMPEVKTAASATRALAMLAAEAFELVIADLDMPKMDGLQFTSIVRGKYPQARLVVLTGMRDEQFRTRAYAMGVDQYWIKPESTQELGLLLEAMESLLKPAAEGSFRGVQSKSLVDIIQLECLSQNSCVLKVTHGVVEGKIWIDAGEVIDAEAAGLRAEPAFQRIMSWKSGNFEVLPADPDRPHLITTSYQGLLLNTVQALDEAASQPVSARPGATPAGSPEGSSLLADVAQTPGVEFVLARGDQPHVTPDCWGLENPQPVAEWMEQTLGSFQALGQTLQLGPVQQVTGTGPNRKLGLITCGQTQLCLGFPPDLPAEELQQILNQVIAKWAS